MTTKTKEKLTYSEKMDRLREKVEKFTEDHDDDTRAEMMQRIRGYSDRNVALILAQDPEALDVRGYAEWDKAERVVAHGQHGIQILAPAGAKQGEKQEDGSETGGRKFFRIAYVFDYAQTEPRSEHLSKECCRLMPWSTYRPA